MTFANNANASFAALVARRDLKSTGRPLLPRQAGDASSHSHRVANVAVAAHERKRRPVGLLKLPAHSAPLQGNAATALMKAARLNGNTSTMELAAGHIQRVWRGCICREELRAGFLKYSMLREAIVAVVTTLVKQKRWSPRQQMA